MYKCSDASMAYHSVRSKHNHSTKNIKVVCSEGLVDIILINSGQTLFLMIQILWERCIYSSKLVCLHLLDIKHKCKLLGDSDIAWWDLHKQVLIHWGRMTRVSVRDWTIIGPCNGFSPARPRIITWTDVDFVPIGPTGANSSEILTRKQTFLQDNTINNVVCIEAAINSSILGARKSITEYIEV